jgi:hypothetical protein
MFIRRQNGAAKAGWFARFVREGKNTGGQQTAGVTTGTSECATDAEPADSVR